MTTTAKVTHTPGPWRLSNPSGEAPAYRILGLHFPQGGIDSIVGDFMNLEGDPEKFEYDAALIAAAPDMLEALEGLLAHRECPVNSPEAEIARAAIAKAKGGAA